MGEIQTRIEEVEVKDLFLLCTDELYGRVADDDIEEMLMLNSVEGRAHDRLLGAALDKRGRDDTTLIVIQMCYMEHHILPTGHDYLYFEVMDG